MSATDMGLRARATAAQLRVAEAAQRAVDEDELSAIENARSHAQRVAGLLGEALTTRALFVQDGLEVAALPPPRRKLHARQV